MKEDKEQNDWFGDWITWRKAVLSSLSYESEEKYKSGFLVVLISILHKCNTYHNPLCNDQE